jgi:hypothetical protein
MYIKCAVPYEYLTPEELVAVQQGKDTTVVEFPKMSNIWKLGILAY